MNASKRILADIKWYTKTGESEGTCGNTDKNKILKLNKRVSLYISENTRDEDDSKQKYYKLTKAFVTRT